MNSNAALHLPELRDRALEHGIDPEIWLHAGERCLGVDSGTCPAVFCIWPRREWMWLSGDPAMCGLCSFYRDRGSPLPCVDHDDDGECDGYGCDDEGCSPLVAARVGVEVCASVGLRPCEEITCS